MLGTSLCAVFGMSPAESLYAIGDTEHVNSRLLSVKQVDKGLHWWYRCLMCSRAAVTMIPSQALQMLLCKKLPSEGRMFNA